LVDVNSLRNQRYPDKWASVLAKKLSDGIWVQDRPQEGRL